MISWNLGAACGAMRRMRLLRFASAEPAADAESFAPRLEHLVLAARRQKANQPAAERLDVDESVLRTPVLRTVDSQHAAIRALPLWIHIQRQRYPALRGSQRLIDMARISASRRILCIVQLQLE